MVCIVWHLYLLWYPLLAHKQRLSSEIGVLAPLGKVATHLQVLCFLAPKKLG